MLVEVLCPPLASDMTANTSQHIPAHPSTCQLPPVTQQHIRVSVRPPCGAHLWCSQLNIEHAGGLVAVARVLLVCRLKTLLQQGCGGGEAKGGIRSNIRSAQANAGQDCGAGREGWQEGGDRGGITKSSRGSATVQARVSTDIAGRSACMSSQGAPPTGLCGGGAGVQPEMQKQR
jgi:hypothetical protein